MALGHGFLFLLAVIVLVLVFLVLLHFLLVEFRGRGFGLQQQIKGYVVARHVCARWRNKEKKDKKKLKEEEEEGGGGRYIHGVRSGRSP